MPVGTGISKIAAATKSTIPHRKSLLRNEILSAGSFWDVSAGSDNGCSTRSSFDWATQQLRDTIPLDTTYSRVFNRLNPIETRAT